MLRKAAVVIILFCFTATEADARRRYSRHRSYNKERSEPKEEKKEEPKKEAKPTALGYLEQAAKCHAAMPYVFTLGDEPVFMSRFDTSTEIQNIGTEMQRMRYPRE